MSIPLWLKISFPILGAVLCYVAFYFGGVWVGMPLSLVLTATYFMLLKQKLTVMALAGGVLMGIAWPAIGSAAPLLLIGMVPLLYAEHLLHERKAERSGRSVFFMSYLSFFAFNAVATWWVYYASGGGAAMALVLNSLFMALVFWVYHFTKKVFGPRIGLYAFVIYWIAFEHLHLIWDFSYPWLNFGNGFANMPSLIQWYEITGVAGGTLWILISNLIVTQIVINVRSKKQLLFGQKKLLAGLLLTIIIPVGASLWRFHTYEEVGEEIETVVVQPNLDPYGAKFYGNAEEQLEDMLLLAEREITANTTWVAFPETSMQEGGRLFVGLNGEPDYAGLWEGHLQNSYSLPRIQRFMEAYPKLNMVMGMTSFQYFSPGKQNSTTSRPCSKGYLCDAYPDGRYEVYNSALFVSTNNEIETYYKSKPLIGVEYMPFAALMKPLESLIIDMGGTTGGLGTQEEPETFKDGKVNAAPIICYESVYGDFVGDFIRKENANVFLIVTNDGWWDNTPGHHQHMYYGALRALEHRRSIARAANTGISCFINQRGEIRQQTEWWVPDAVRGTVHLNESTTFYTRYGDFIGRSLSFVALFLFLYALVKRWRDKRDPLRAVK